jgi:hypothetical protein
MFDTSAKTSLIDQPTSWRKFMQHALNSSITARSHSGKIDEVAPAEIRLIQQQVNRPRCNLAHIGRELAERSTYVGLATRHGDTRIPVWMTVKALRNKTTAKAVPKYKKRFVTMHAQSIGEQKLYKQCREWSIKSRSGSISRRLIIDPRTLQTTEYR